MGKRQSADCLSICGADQDGFSQLAVDVVSAVLDGNHTAVSLMGDHGDRFTGVTAQRKQEGVQLFVVGFDPLNDVRFSFLCVS